ncbi:MAG: hypothetical protein HUJ95_03025, partial [Bacteroidales bacterium]|nr:hypothetical protein [Bacteroidales bacterium]
ILNATALKPAKESWITISYSKDGHEFGYYQFQLSEVKVADVTPLGSTSPNKKVTCTAAEDGSVTLTGGNTTAQIGSDGLLASFIKKKKEYIIQPLRPIFTRVFTDNDARGWYKKDRPYYTDGNFDFKTKLVETTYSSASYILESPQVRLTLIYAIDEKGVLTIDYDASFDYSFAGEPLRVGLYGIVLCEGDKMEFVGRGPWENYCDRNSSAQFGKYSGKIEDFAFEYIKPQENGNHTGVSYLQLGKDLEFSAVGSPFEAGVNNASFEGLSGKNHTPEVVRLPSGQAALYIQAAQAGVGGTDTWSLRAAPLTPYRLTSKNYHFRFNVK